MSEENNIIKLARFRPLIMMLILLIVTMSFLKLVNVTKIECYIDEKKDTGEICSYFSSLNNKSLFFADLNTDEIVKNINSSQNKKGSYYFERMEKRFPSTLLIYLVDEPAIYRHKTDDGEDFLLNKQGRVKIDDVSVSFPEVKGFFTIDELSRSEKLPLHIHQYILDLVESLEKENITFSLVEQKENGEIIIYLQNGLIATTDRETSAREEIKRLSMVLNLLMSTNEEEIEVSSIDLRFNYPVLK